MTTSGEQGMTDMARPWDAADAVAHQIMRECHGANCFRVGKAAQLIRDRFLTTTATPVPATELAALREQLAAIEKCLPSTYYADRTLEIRVGFIVDHWRRAVEALNLLQGKPVTEANKGEQ